MIPAWRGFVYQGQIWAWPTLLWQHKDAVAVLPPLREATCQWRQWESGGKPDFDPGTSEEDKRLVEDWLNAVHPGS